MCDVSAALISTSGERKTFEPGAMAEASRDGKHEAAVTVQRVRLVVGVFTTCL